MSTRNFQDPVDLFEVEARARQLRARALSDGMTALGRWVSSSLGRRGRA